MKSLSMPIITRSDKVQYERSAYDNQRLDQKYDTRDRAICAVRAHSTQPGMDVLAPLYTLGLQDTGSSQHWVSFIIGIRIGHRLRDSVGSSVSTSIALAALNFIKRKHSEGLQDSKWEIELSKEPKTERYGCGALGFPRFLRPLTDISIA